MPPPIYGVCLRGDDRHRTGHGFRDGRFRPGCRFGTIGVYGVNDCGLGVPSSFAVIVSECAGIGDNSLLSSVTLFPNPVEGKLNIRISGKENG